MIKLCEFSVVHLRSIGGAYTSLGFPELHCASFSEIIELVTAFIKAGGCEISQGDCAGHALLLWEAENGYDGVVKLLPD